MSALDRDRYCWTYACLCVQEAEVERCCSDRWFLAAVGAFSSYDAGLAASVARNTFSGSSVVWNFQMRWYPWCFSPEILLVLLPAYCYIVAIVMAKLTFLFLLLCSSLVSFLFPHFLKRCFYLASGCDEFGEGGHGSSGNSVPDFYFQQAIDEIHLFGLAVWRIDLCEECAFFDMKWLVGVLASWAVANTSWYTWYGRRRGANSFRRAAIASSQVLMRELIPHHQVYASPCKRKRRPLIAFSSETFSDVR